MALCWVKAGICGQETTVEVRKTSQTKAAVSLTTTCEYVQALGAELSEMDVPSEITKPMNETATYTLATRHLCRNSCIVPAAILKAAEAAAGIFLPDSCAIEFVEGTV